MKKILHSRPVCFLLALILLMQNLAIPVHANDDGVFRCPICNSSNLQRHDPVPPTCEEIGWTEWYSCKEPNCTGKLEPDKVASTGHTEETIPGKDATCTETGLTDGVKCSVCGKILTAQEEIPLEPHALFTRGAKAATCTEAGWTEHKLCENGCGYREGYEEIPALEHQKNVTTEAKAATCTENGCTEGWECTREGCDYKVASEVITATGHTPETVTGKAATCTEDGLTDGAKCSVCNEILTAQQVIPAGHKEVIDPAVPSTCTTKGKTEGRHCSVCNTVLVAQTETELAAHTPATDPAVPATCTTKGKTEGSHCSVCNTVLVAQTETDFAAHTEKSIPGQAATCTKDGLTDGKKCSVCGKILKAQEVIPAAHQNVVDMEAKDPTCTEPGQEGGKYCTVCGEIVEQPTHLPASGHEKKVTTEAKAATCTEDGCTEGWYCEVCQEEVKSEVIPATGHTEVTLPGKKATCTATGLTEGKKCSVCGEILTAQKEIAKTGHTEVSIPGRAATCKQTGLTEGKKCSVCGKELTPQYATPKSTVHKFVPAKDTDPNAGPLDYVCSVCGEKQVGLSQGDGAAFVPYEQVDPSSGSNGFTMTTGNDYATEGSAQAMAEEINSGKLQVFKGKDGNDENLLCLVSPDSTMTYLSFEAGTSGIDKVSIASQNNPGGGATILEPSANVGQFGFGIGSDENGKSYLYVQEDGKEVSFTITKEEDEDGRNRVILTTENGSKITIESDSLWYKVQSWDEGSELSGSQLEVEKTTSTLTNTNENGGSSEAVVIEIVFSVKDLGGSEEQPEETKPENGIQAIEEQEQTIEELDTGDNSITVLEESEQAKNYVDIIDLSPQGISEEDWDPENCKNDIHWPVNGICKFCGEGCTHKYDNKLNVTAKEHTCILCGYTAAHRWIRWQNVDGTYVGYMSCVKCGYHCGHPSYSYASEGVCKCNECGLASIHHWENGICKKCSGKCPHSKVDKKCVCKECGLVAHNYKISPAYDTDSVCTRCKARCSHPSFVIDGDYCKCTTCGRIQTHYWKYSATPLPSCVCKYCGKTEEHDYDPVTGTCKRCMNECDHTCVSISVGKCQCTKCGYTMSHKWVEGKSGCVCSYCGYELSHLFSMTWGGTTHYVAEYGKTSCTRCGAECKHSFSNCRCTICGLQAKHKWRNGTCTVCGTVCEHLGCNYRNTTDCVCSECGTVRKHDWKKKGIFYECTQCGFLTLRKPK